MLMGLETHNVQEPLPLRAVTGRKTGGGQSVAILHFQFGFPASDPLL